MDVCLDQKVQVLVDANFGAYFLIIKKATLRPSRLLDILG